MIRQMVICTIDHTHLKLKLKLKLSNMYTYINLLHYTPPFLLGLTTDWHIEDSDGS